MLNKYGEYSQKECVKISRNLKFKETNDCNYKINSLDYDFSVILDDLSINKTMIQCIENSIKKTGTSYSDYCPEECDSLTYDINLHSAMITGNGNVTSKSNPYLLVAGFNTYENVSRTYFAIRIYYEESRYTLISQQAKIELFGLISNIGGSLGLFIGFSFISLLELVEVLAEFVYIGLS